VSADPRPRTRPSPLRCRVCDRTVLGTAAVCFCCRTVATQLRLPLVPLAALVEYRVGDRDHHRLRAYKDAGAPELRERCLRALTADLATACARPGSAPPLRWGTWAVVTTVPSSNRPGPAPAERLVDGVPALADRHLRLLTRGGGAGGHLQAGREVFRAAPGVDRGSLADLPVLVFDDTTTTGASLQSAAAALRLAGARVVGAVAMGRALAPVVPGGRRGR
jgi:hypothetical protein